MVVEKWGLLIDPILCCGIFMGVFSICFFYIVHIFASKKHEK